MKTVTIDFESFQEMQNIIEEQKKLINELKKK